MPLSATAIAALIAVLAAPWSESTAYALDIYDANQISIQRPENADSMEHLALEHANKLWSEKDLLGALQTYNQILQYNASHEPALLGRWRVLSSLGLHQEALLELQSALPSNSSTMQTLHEDGAAQAIR